MNQEVKKRRGVNLGYGRGWIVVALPVLYLLSWIPINYIYGDATDAPARIYTYMEPIGWTYNTPLSKPVAKYFEFINGPPY